MSSTIPCWHHLKKILLKTMQDSVKTKVMQVDIVLLGQYLESAKLAKKVNPLFLIMR